MCVIVPLHCDGKFPKTVRVCNTMCEIWIIPKGDVNNSSLGVLTAK